MTCEPLNFLKMIDKTSDAINVKLLKGKRYSFCSCGLSKNLPYCDNAHREYMKRMEQITNPQILAKEDTEVMVYSATWKR